MTVLSATCRRDVGERAEPGLSRGRTRGRTLREDARWQARHGVFGVGKLQLRESSFTILSKSNHGAWSYSRGDTLLSTHHAQMPCSQRVRMGRYSQPFG